MNAPSSWAGGSVIVVNTLVAGTRQLPRPPVPKTILIDFKDDGVLIKMKFSNRADFKSFLARQGAGGVLKVGSDTAIDDFNELVEGATYAFVFAGYSLHNDGCGRA